MLRIPAKEILFVDYKIMLVSPAENLFSKRQLHLPVKLQVESHIRNAVIKKQVFEKFLRNILPQSCKKLGRFSMKRIYNPEGILGTMNGDINLYEIFMITNKLNLYIRKRQFIARKILK